MKKLYIFDDINELCPMLGRPNNQQQTDRKN
jgi:hypothetical protein